MRRHLLALLCALPLSAQAQVTTNDHALDSLKSSDSKPRQPATHAHARRERPSPHAKPSGAAVVAPGQKLPNVPAGPPPNPVIAPPPLAMPAHAPPPPPPVPLRADAIGKASSISGGTRLTFGPGAATLNPGTFQALQAIAQAAKANPAQSVTITAWAPGTADDPSTPRRLSLDRALAARAVLINAGIASERIHAIAKGMTDIGDAVADRVDISLAQPAK